MPRSAAGSAITAFGLALAVLALWHGGGGSVLLPRLSFALLFVVAGAVTVAAVRGDALSPRRPLMLLGAAIVAGACLNLVIAYFSPGSGWLAKIVPVLPPHGMDFRDGLYAPAVAFSTAKGGWPPLTLLIGRPFLLIGPDAGYVVQVVLLVALAAVTCVLSARLASYMDPARERAGVGQRALRSPLLLVGGLWLFTSYGLFFELERGNVDLYALFFSLLAVLLLLDAARSPWLPAISLSLAINIKVYPAILLTLLFWRYRWRAVLPVAVSNIVLFLLAGPHNAWQSLTSLASMQGKPYLWVGNLSATSTELRSAARSECGLRRSRRRCSCSLLEFGSRPW